MCSTKLLFSSFSLFVVFNNHQLIRLSWLRLFGMDNGNVVWQKTKTFQKLVYTFFWMCFFLSRNIIIVTCDNNGPKMRTFLDFSLVFCPLHVKFYLYLFGTIDLRHFRESIVSNNLRTCYNHSIHDALRHFKHSVIQFRINRADKCWNYCYPRFSRF